MTPGKGSKEHYFTFIETESREPYHKSYSALIFPNSSYHWQEVCHIGDVLVYNLVFAVDLPTRLGWETSEPPDIWCPSSKEASLTRNALREGKFQGVMGTNWSETEQLRKRGQRHMARKRRTSPMWELVLHQKVPGFFWRAMYLTQHLL